MIRINDDKCFGCGACASACPKNAIKMVINEFGFYHPIIDMQSCIKCNLCSKVCPINNQIANNTFEKKAYAFRNNDNTLWNRCSSGGAFETICRTVDDGNTYIFGCNFSKLHAKHSFVKGSNNAKLFNKSKYVQSEMSTIYKDVKKLLELGNRVIWSGTPCQCHGLILYLGKKYENLIIIDLVCHGVGSVKVFEKFIKWNENIYKKDIIDYTFRFKPKRKQFNPYSSNIIFSDGSHKFKHIDMYNFLFLQRYCTNVCCDKYCKYHCQNRVSDITLADLKAEREIFSNSTKQIKNCSVIIANTRRGSLIINDIASKKFLMKQVNLDLIIKYNPLFDHDMPCDLDKKSIFKDLENNDFRVIKRKYNNFYSNFSSIILSKIPIRLKLNLKRKSKR